MPGKDKNNSRKLRVAFIKFAGMTIGGSELGMQKIAAHLPKDKIDVDYYYCDDAPYAGAEHALAPTSQGRIDYVKKSGVNLIKFSVAKKDVRRPTHPWIGTDFWEKFDPKKYDLVQTVKAGPKEYPYYKIPLPVVEIVALASRPDTGKNIAWSFHSSPWQRAQWVRKGGSMEKSSVLSAQIEVAESPEKENYRAELGIPAHAIVAGFHQRADNNIASPIPLQAFADIQKRFPEESKNWHFIIKNGGSWYRDQAAELGIRNMHFLPETPDVKSVSKFLNTLDIFAHGRKDGETFGAVLVEAMIHGLPCISHETAYANAQPETMGPAGMFAHDQGEYTTMLHRLFSDDEFRTKLASKARAHAHEYHSMRRCMEQILNVYEKITRIPLTDAGATKEPIPYGYSDMGFLYAGDMNKKYNIAYHVLSGGIPEAFDVAIVRSLLSGTNTFLDIGANTGIYCWIAADFYAKRQLSKIGSEKVIAYEPQPDCVEALRKTVFLNNWGSIVDIEQIGLGEAGGELTLHVSGTGSSVVPHFINAVSPTLQIKIDTVDDQVRAKKLLSVDFIKIDVEGHELSVMKGAADTIEKNKPIIFVEIARRIRSRGYVNENYEETLAWLFKRGYRIWISERNKLKEIDPDYRHADGVAMYLCLDPRKHADKIAGLDATVRNYRSENLFLGLIEKMKIKKAFNRIIPEYITSAKILGYAKGILIPKKST